jgi:hypothetical protein
VVKAGRIARAQRKVPDHSARQCRPARTGIERLGRVSGARSQRQAFSIPTVTAGLDEKRMRF